VLSSLFADQLHLGFSQAAVAALMAIAVMWLARTRGIHLERETLIALLRGFVQVVAVGSVILILLQGPIWMGVPVLLAMIVSATAICGQRAKGIPGAFRVSLIAILIGSGTVILIMTSFGVIDWTLTSLIPVGSMLIANAMNTNSLALDRFRSEIQSHVGQIEAALALGADPRAIIQPYAQAAVQASLIPRVDTLRSLGIVWIPGIMAGMILSGTDPVYAAVYQFVVIAMIYASAGLTSVVSTLLIRSRIFSQADQLLLREEEQS